MANQDLPHTRPVLCGTLYYCTAGCVVQYSIPVGQQYRCRVGVWCSRQYYLPTVYSIVVWYSIVHSMYVYTIVQCIVQYIVCMYVSLYVLLLCQCCCVRERLSLARQQPACLVPLPCLCLSVYLPHPTYLHRCVCSSSILLLLCVIVLVIVCMQYTQQMYVCVVYMLYCWVGMQYSSSMCIVQYTCIDVSSIHRQQYSTQCMYTCMYVYIIIIYYNYYYYNTLYVCMYAHSIMCIIVIVCACLCKPSTPYPWASVPLPACLCGGECVILSQF